MACPATGTMYIFRMPPLFEPLKEKFFCKGSSTLLSSSQKSERHGRPGSSWTYLNRWVLKSQQGPLKCNKAVTLRFGWVLPQKSPKSLAICYLVVYRHWYTYRICRISCNKCLFPSISPDRSFMWPAEPPLLSGTAVGFSRSYASGSVSEWSTSFRPSIFILHMSTWNVYLKKRPALSVSMDRRFNGAADRSACLPEPSTYQSIFRNLRYHPSSEAKFSHASRRNWKLSGFGKFSRTFLWIFIKDVWGVLVFCLLEKGKNM